MNRKSWPVSLWRRLLGQRRQPPLVTEYPRFYDRRLERRRVLDAGPAGDLGSLLVDAGEAANNHTHDQFTITIRQQESVREVAIEVNGELAGTLTGETSEPLHVVGSADYDTLVISEEPTSAGSGGEPGALTASGVSYEFLGDGSTLQVTIRHAEFDHDLVLLISHVEQIVDQLSASQRVFMAGGDAQSLTLSDNGQAGDGLSLLESSLGTSVEFANPSGSLELLAGGAAGAAQLQLQGTDSLLAADLLLAGNSSTQISLGGTVQTGGHSLTGLGGDIMVTGQLDTAGGDLTLAAQRLNITSIATITVGQGHVNLYAAQLNQAGQLSGSAESLVRLDAGPEGILTVSGSIEARGGGGQETGGTVVLSGREVELLGTAVIDVSGTVGGGSILVGGGLRGASATIPNAQQTTVAEGARLMANAVAEGDGGLVVVWSDRQTQYAGRIESRGGALGGDGGVAEVSGGEHLLFGGEVDLSAANGEVGLLILDPATWTITATDPPGTDQVSTTQLAAAMVDQMLLADVSVVFEDLADGDDLIQLMNDVDLIVETVNAAGDAPGGISFANLAAGIDSIVAGGDGQLIFHAGTDGAEEADITNYAHLTTDTGAIELTASGSISGLGDLTSTSGNITVRADTNTDGTGSISLGGLVQTTGGTIHLEAVSLDVADSTINADTGMIEFATGDFTLSSSSSLTAGELAVISGANLLGSGTIGASLRVADSGSSVSPGGTDPGLLTIAGDFDLQADTTLAMQLDGTTAATGYDQVSLSGDLTLAGSLLLSAGFTAGVGDSFTIVELTDAAATITGTFAGLSEGATVVVAGQTFEITYTGGDGNDIVLSTVAASLSIAATDATKAEGDGGSTAFTFTVSRTGNTDGTDSATYTVTGSGTNQANLADFAGGALPSGTVTFADGEASAMITIMVAGDELVELNEGFTVTLSAPSTGAEIGTAAATGTITNDDSATITLVGGTADESAGTLVYTVTLDHAVDTDISVNFSTRTGGTAENSAFDSINNQPVTIIAGQTTATVNVTIHDDNLVEVNETVNARVNSLASAGRAVSLAGGSEAAGVGTIANDDTATVSITDVSVTEGNGGTVTATFTVTLSHAVDVAVSFDADTVNGTATTAGGDYTAVDTSRTIAANSAAGATATISVTVQGDQRVEVNETFLLRLSNLVATNAAGNRDVVFSNGELTLDGTGTITNDDQATVSISNVTVTEGNSGSVLANFTVTLSHQVDAVVSFDADTVDGSATSADGDYTALSSSGSFAANSAAGATTTLSVEVQGDVLVEPDETFLLRLSNLMAGGLNVIFNGDVMTLDGTGTITNDDTLEVAIGNATANESSGVITFEITLSQQSSEDVTVTFETLTDGSADSDVDFTAVTMFPVMFMAGETSKMVDVMLTEDAIVEGSEEINVQVSLGSGMSLQTALGTGTIEDNDQATVSITGVSVSEGDNGSVMAEFTVTLSHQVDAAVSFDADTVDGSATSADGDFTALSTSGGFAANSMAGATTTVSVEVLGDELVELNETYLLRLSNLMAAGLDVIFVGDTSTIDATGTITDDDQATISISNVTVTEGNSGSVLANFTVTLSHQVDAVVSFDADTVDGSATSADGDYTALSSSGGFAANSMAGETTTISVEVLGDELVELNETFLLRLSNLMAGGLNVIFNGDVMTLDGTGTITNDDTLEVAIGNATANESSGVITFEITLSQQSSEDVTVTFETLTDGSADSDVDFTAVTMFPVMFMAGETSKTVDVMLIEDAIVEGSEEINVQVSLGSGMSLQTALGTGTIEDNDQATVSITGVTVTEGDNGSVLADFTVTLSHQVDAAVSFDADTVDGSATSADGDFTALSTSGGFAANSMAGATTTVSVEVLGDELVELNETYLLRLSNLMAAGLDVIFVGDTSTIDATGTITDDDQATISIADVSVTEGNSGSVLANFTVTLSHQVDAVVSFDADTVDGSATSADGDYTALSSSGGFAANSMAGETTTISVEVLGDELVELNETFLLRLSNLMAAGGLNVIFDGGNSTLDGTGTITNNDQATLSITGVSVTEGNAGSVLADFTVTLSHQVDGAVSFGADTVDGSATAVGGDYTALSTTGGFAANSMAGATVTLSVEVLDDEVVELNEAFLLRLSNLMAGGLNVLFAGGTPTLDGTGTITNDDQATLSFMGVTVTEGNAGAVLADFTVTLSHQVDGAVSFDADTVDGTATSADGDYTALSTSAAFAANSTPGSTVTISVEVQGDELVELNETYFLRLSNLLAGGLNVIFSGDNPTLDGIGAITNDDQAQVSITGVTADESTGQLSFQLTLSHRVDTDVSVHFDTLSGGTAAAGADFTAETDQLVTFTAGSTMATATVTILDDNLVEGAETVLTRIETLLAGGRNVVLSTVNATGTITDNNDAATISLVGGSAAEAGGVLQFTAVLSNPVDVAVSVQFDTLATGNAAVGIDFTALADLLVTFAPETQEVTINVMVIDDTDVEPDETVVAELNTLTPVARNVSFSGGIRSEGTGMITNDDSAMLTINSVSQLEGTGSDTDFLFTVTLSNAVQGGFTAPISFADGTATDAEDFNPVTLGPLTFAGNAMETHTILVRVQGDSTIEADETFSVALDELQMLSAAAKAAITRSDPGVGTIVNDDTGQLSVVLVSDVLEGNMGTTNMTFEVRLSNATSRLVTVRATTADGLTPGTNAVAGEDYTALDQTITFLPGASGAGLVQTVTISVSTDLRYELDEILLLSLSDPRFVGLPDPDRVAIGTGTAEGRIRNDDTDIIETGGAGDDRFVLISTGIGSGSFVVTRSGVAGPTIPFSGVTSATFSGGDGDDQMVIQHTGSDLFGPAGGIVFNGGGQTDADRLEIVGGAIANAVATITSANDGTLLYDGVLATFNDVEAVYLLPQTLAELNTTLSGNVAHEIVLEDDAAPANGIFQLRSVGASTPLLRFANPQTMFTLDAGAGDDTITVDASFDSTTAAGSFRGGLTLLGGSGTDAVNLQGGLSLAGKDLIVEAEQIEVTAALGTGGGVVSFDADTITMTAAASIRSGSGTISLMAEHDIVISSLESQNAGMAIMVESRAGQLIDGGDSLRDLIAPSGTIDLRAATGIGNSSALETEVLGVTATTVSGDIQISEADILLLQGAHITGGGGAGEVVISATVLVLDANGTGISVMNNANVTLDASLQLILRDTAQADDILLAGSGTFIGRAGGQISAQGDPVIRTQSGSIVGLPTEADISVVPAVLDPTGANVNTDNEASLTVGLPAGSRYEVTVDFNLFDNSESLAAGFDQRAPLAGNTFEQFDYTFFLGNPTGNDTSNIPYTVRVEFAYINASENAIQFFSGGQPLVILIERELTVPANGLQSLSVIVPTENVQQRAAPLVLAERVIPPQNTTDSPTNALEFSTLSGDFTPPEVQRVELRLVTPGGDEIAVFDWARGNLDILQNLAELFEDLPDDRYRIYLIRADGTEQLVVDVVLRQHKPFDPLDEAEADRSRPPRYQAQPEEQEQPEGEKPQPAAESSAEQAPGLPEQLDLKPPENSGAAVESPAVPATLAAAAAAGTALLAVPRQQRHDDNQSQLPPPHVSFRKIARLARRVLRSRNAGSN